MVEEVVVMGMVIRVMILWFVLVMIMSRMILVMMSMLVIIDD